MKKYYLNFTKIKELTADGNQFFIKLVHRYVNEMNERKLILERQLENLADIDLDKSLQNFYLKINSSTNKYIRTLNEYQISDSDELSDTDEQEDYDYDDEPDDIDTFNPNDAPGNLARVAGSVKKPGVDPKRYNESILHKKFKFFKNWANKFNVPKEKLSEDNYILMQKFLNYTSNFGKDIHDLTIEVNKNIIKHKYKQELNEYKENFEFIRNTLIHNGILVEIRDDSNNDKKPDIIL